ncbi:MAG: hypothetical protein ABID87_01455 [Chloroflexota bacterium]
MTIAWFRDLVICILGLAGTATLIFIGALVYAFYRKLSPLLDAQRETAQTIERLVNYVDVEVTKPMAHVATFVQGVTQALSLIRRFTGRR